VGKVGSASLQFCVINYHRAKFYQKGPGHLYITNFFLIVQVEEIGHEITTGPSGDYFRLLTPGTYTITVTADGYEKMTQVSIFNNFFVVDGEAK